MYVFQYFYKKRDFLNIFFNFWNGFYFLEGKFLIQLNLLNSYIKRLLSDGFNMAAIGNSLMKSHSPQTLSCTLYDTKTNWRISSFSLNKFVNLSATFLFNVF